VDYICYFQVEKLDNYKLLCKIYQGNSERLYSLTLTSYFFCFVMSHEILFLFSNLFLFFNSQVKSALLCCSLMCAWIRCSHPVKGVIKLSCCMQYLVLMLSSGVWESPMLQVFWDQPYLSWRWIMLHCGYRNVGHLVELQEDSLKW
jgi:hypothetical protein